jgi:hypothetical protein
MWIALSPKSSSNIDGRQDDSIYVNLKINMDRLTERRAAKAKAVIPSTSR